MGVRGIKLQNNDRIISASILNSVDISTDEREGYLKYATSLRRNRSKKSEIKKDRIENLKIKKNFYYQLLKMVLEKDLHLMSIEKPRGARNNKYRNFRKKWSVVASFPVQDDEEVIMVTNEEN